MRILAGSYKGRKLLSPPRASGSRPITGSVKKSLFDILGGALVGATVADLYCGTGSLGLEALSRGAARCAFAERDRRVVRRLRRNIEAVGAGERCVVWCGDVRARLASWLAELDASLGAAFVDPPYASARRWSWPAVTRQVFDPLAEYLVHGGRVVVRLPAGVAPPDALGPLAVLRRRRYGQMVVALYGRADAGEAQ